MTRDPGRWLASSVDGAPSGWRRMVAVAEDIDKVHGASARIGTTVDGRPLELDRGREGLVPVEGGRCR
jgi:hypothetical protein